MYFSTSAPVILADSGDNPTGGGVGDRADVLAALIARDWQGAILAGIADLPATEACFAAGAGAWLDLTIGASLDPSSVPVTLRARIDRLDPGTAPADRQAVISTGGIRVVPDTVVEIALQQARSESIGAAPVAA